MDKWFESGMVNVGLYWKEHWGDFQARLFRLMANVEIVEGPLAPDAIAHRDCCRESILRVVDLMRRVDVQPFSQFFVAV